MQRLLCCLRDLEFILSEPVVWLRSWKRAIWATLKWILLDLDRKYGGGEREYKGTVRWLVLSSQKRNAVQKTI